MNRFFWHALLLVAVAFCTQLQGSEMVTVSGRAMGTVWTVKFIQPARALDASVVKREVATRLEELEQMFSSYRADSEVSRFNAQAATTWFPVAPEIAHVAADSRRISELTGGAFDVTVDPLVRLWGFGPGGGIGVLPRQSEIAQVRDRVDWRRLEIRAEPPALRKTRADLTADFSSMAKGYAVDAIDELLVRLGASNYLAQIAGDVRTGGIGVNAAGWPIGIEEPREGTRSIACVVRLEGEALSTSGDYRNFVMVGGQRYGHIIDPRTGSPAANGLAAVSVVHGSCAESSALATALFVLGPEEGFRLAMQERIAAIFFVRDGAGFAQWMTPEFEKRLRRKASAPRAE